MKMSFQSAGLLPREKPLSHIFVHSGVGAGAYTGPWAEVVFGPYKGGTFIAMAGGCANWELAQR